jgi:hypothetical protein
LPVSSGDAVMRAELWGRRVEACLTAIPLYVLRLHCPGLGCA